ncbi:hypothetical protein [Pedobacter sp. SYSU D00535]|uniref:hypothetical protein n=1 Tax=Pedobacter sp. SYSU D00535 TaxID=2810308 RepID=UPI001A95D986|nr:hypothetical protein [Pedobacter sp. SYSU D00535]
MTHYRLQIPSFNQYKFAWAELTQEATISKEFPQCPKCNRAMGQRYWLPPHDIILKQPKKVGDFVGGVIGTDLIVSQRFKDKYQESDMSGISKFIELNVVQMGTSKNTPYPIPKLFGAAVETVNTKVDYDKMGVSWFSKPKKNNCDLCCPGGGGDGGIYQTYEKVVLKQETLTQNDFFIPINFTGNIMVTERAKEFIDRNQFTNVQLTPDFDAKHDIFKVD